MFQIADNFEFDENDLLESDNNGCNVSRKLENERSNIFQKEDKFCLQPVVAITKPNFFTNNTNENRPDSGSNFLNAWEVRREQNLNSDSKKLFFPDKSESTRIVKKTVRQRKFPGPAGLLPERQGNTSLIATEEFLEELNSENDETSNFQEEELMSQSTERFFESGAWMVMMDDLGPSGKTLISSMNLATLRLKHTRGYKVPFLAVIINNIDCTLPDPTVNVKDLTGEMRGMLHREVWDKFNAEMTPGSVLVLRNVGVISAGSTSRRHVLNITANNLIAIYSLSQDEQIHIRNISELPTGDNSKMLYEWKQIVSTPILSENRCSPIINSPIFNNSNITFSTNISTPKLIPTIKQAPLVRRQVLKQPANNSYKSFNNSTRPTEQPVNKKHKNMTQNTKSTGLIKPNPFKVNADVSMVDSLLDGIDTDSLFDEF